MILKMSFTEVLTNAVALNYMVGILGVFKVLPLYLCGVCYISWMHNLVYYIFFKRRKYIFQSVNLFPLLWIRNNPQKWKLSFYINSFMEVHTQVSFLDMKEKEDCEKYVVLYRKCVKRILSVDIIMACLFLLTAFISAAAAIFLSTMVVSVIVLNNVEPTDVMQGGIWRLGMKQGKEYSLFLKVFLEECNREVIYNYVQENTDFNFEEVNEKIFIGNVLVDSINDKKDYILSKVKMKLEKEFLYCSEYQLERYTADYLRLIKIYYCYLLNMNENQNNIKHQIENNWEILEEGCSKYRFGKKLLEAISHKEPYNINNHYEIYNRKMKLIYQ